jgi:hypothetical protein
MAIADSKKCQTFINMIKLEQDRVKLAVANLEAIKAKYLANTPVITGTVLQGRIAAINTWIAALKVLADDATMTTISAAYVESHRNEAYDG